MTLLYNDDFAPITTSIGFLATDLDSAVETYTSWVGGIEAQHGRKLRVSKLDGPLNAVLPKLLPLTTGVKTRALLVPTAGPWVAYFDNFVLGTDASSALGHLAQLLKRRTIAITAVDEEREQARPVGRRDAATAFLLFEPHNTDWLNIGRSITMGNEERWSFQLSGTEQPFEDPSVYQQRKVKDRFPIELLDKYLQALGIRAFDPSFYLPEGTHAVLIEKIGAYPKKPQEFGLKEVFARYPSPSQ